MGRGRTSPWDPRPVVVYPHSSNVCFFLFFSSRRRHTRCSRDWSFRRVLFRSSPVKLGHAAGEAAAVPVLEDAAGGEPEGILHVGHFRWRLVGARPGEGFFARLLIALGPVPVPF